MKVSTRGFPAGLEYRVDDGGGIAGVHEVVDDEPAVAVAFHGLEDFFAAGLFAALIGTDAQGVDQTDVELTGHDGGRDKPAARDADDALERSLFQKAPCQRFSVAVELIPCDGVQFLITVGLAHTWFPLGFRVSSRLSPEGAASRTSLRSARRCRSYVCRQGPALRPCRKRAFCPRPRQDSGSVVR